MTDNAVATRFVYSFDHDHGIPPRDLPHVLGGKGAGLAEMTSRLGLAVPPGFTVALTACLRFRSDGWPDGLDAELRQHVADLGERMGRRFGDEADPLLVAVRSGAPVSMPGMLDTILNLGLNERSVAGLARASGDELFAWDSYRRFIEMFATTVMGVTVGEGAREDPPTEVGEAEERVAALLAEVEARAGRPVPSDPWQQLREAVEAVFRSWDSPRARVYRQREHIDEALGTAVNVQAMVFGNRGPRSGTGVVFTRDPSTGDEGPYGDYLPRAQGEEVVAGLARTMAIRELGTHEPDVYEHLRDELRRLEVHYRDMCDVEFTVEDGRLWLLQTRVGKRGAIAAVRLAVALAADPDIALGKDEALARAPQEVRAKAREEVLARYGDGITHGERPLATGLGASPGRATGPIVLTSEAAMDSAQPAILVRRETSPEDVAGMAASAGVLTCRGGLVSHAAVVARGWGIPAVVGASELVLTADTVAFPDGTVLAAGDVVTVDGTTGRIWRGAVAETTHELSAEELLPELAVLDGWARETGS